MNTYMIGSPELNDLLLPLAVRAARICKAYVYGLTTSGYLEQRDVIITKVCEDTLFEMAKHQNVIVGRDGDQVDFSDRINTIEAAILNCMDAIGA
jgi:hypothetical protein